METRMFITICNGIITSRQETTLKQSDLFGTPWYTHEQIDIPHNAQVMIGDKIEFYDTSWKRKTDIQLIDEGLLPMPEGHVREGDELRALTAEERILAELDDPQPGFKVDDGKIVPMTLQEQLDAGLILQEDYEKQQEAENIAELERRLAELQTPIVEAKAKRDPVFAAERDAKMDALLAVMEQPGWPLEVVWPESS